MSDMLPASGDLDRFGRLSLLAIVSVAVGATVAMNEAALLAPENLGILALGSLFLTLLVAVGERLARLGAVMLALYFACQLALASGIFLLQGRLGSFGMAWLLLMPLLVQGVFASGRGGIALLTAATTLLPALHVYRLAGATAALEVGIGIAAASAFVLLFSLATVRERRAREESERLAGELAEANRRLAELAVESEELATARERNRLAREIHDSVGHGLTVGHVQIRAARVHLSGAPQAALTALDAAAAAVRQGLDELRLSVASLRSPPLAGRSLVDALEAMRREAEGDGRTAALEIRGAVRPLDPEIALTLYRVAQEGLTNVSKHSDAGRVEIVLAYREDGASLSVTDDGRGGTTPGTTGFGILGLRERLALHGGRLESGALPAGGFRLHAEVG